MSEENTKPGYKYPPVRFKRAIWHMLKLRAADLARERGNDDMSLPQYLTEASDYFEKHRDKSEPLNG